MEPGTILTYRGKQAISIYVTSSTFRSQKGKFKQILDQFLFITKKNMPKNTVKT